MNCKKDDLLLYAVTDRIFLHGAALYEQVKQSLAGGVTMVQLREKKISEEQFLEEAVAIRRLCTAYQVPLIINDNVWIACKSDADGVHIGQKDMDIGTARRILGPHKIIGVSARTTAQAISAFEQGADYLGTGAVFPTGTKQDAQVITYEQLAAVCRAVPIPVAAIGGITEKNLDRLAGSGISGIAVVSAIFAQKDIRQAAKRLRDRVSDLCGTGCGNRKEYDGDIL